jgi:hypothetical protein
MPYLAPIKILYILLITVASAIYIWSMSHVFVQNYDIEYVRDLYDHSQWTISEHTRSIGDDGVFQASADRYITTGNIHAINQEVPPVAKYIFALSLLIFGTPYLLMPIIYYLAILAFLLVVLDMEKGKKALIALILILMEPLIGKQIGMTMLELPQLSLLLIHILFLFYLGRSTVLSRTLIFATLSGITLGLFAGTKFGVLGIALLVADSWFLIINRKTKHIITLLVTSSISYFLISLPYFISGYSIIDWMKIEWRRLSFYGNSQTPTLFGSVFITMFVPFHITWWTNTPQFFKEWSALWPLIPVALIIYGKQNLKLFIASTLDRLKEVTRIKAKEIKWYETEDVQKYLIRKRISYIWLLTIFFLIIYAIIPFWPRNLTLLVPLGIIMFVIGINWPTILSKIPKTLTYTIAVTFLMGQTILLITALRPSVGDSAKQIGQLIEKSTYQDLYDSLSNISSDQETRREYWRRLKTIENTMRVQDKLLSIKTSYVFPWQNQTQGVVYLTYQTPIGEFNNKTNVNFKRINNKWHLEWNGDLLLPGYSKGDQVIVEELPAEGGTIFDTQERVISEVTYEPVIYIMPRNVVNEEKIIQDTSEITGIPKETIHAKLYANHPYDTYARIGFPKEDFNIATLNELTKQSGVRISDEQRRVIHNNITREQRDIVSEIIKNNPQLEPVIGGTIKLRKSSTREEIVVFETKPKPGADLIIEL